MEKHDRSQSKFLQDFGITNYTQECIPVMDMSTFFKIKNIKANGEIEYFILKISQLSELGFKEDQKAKRRGDDSGTQGYEARKQRALTEYSIMKEHSHEVNILKAFHGKESPDGKWFYLLCEYWGEDLYRRSHGQTIPIEIIADWAEQLVKIMKYCEEEGIYHGDIKPMNVLINDNNEIKLTNFSISKVFDQNEYFMEETMVDKITGLTKNYMAPEYFQIVEERHRGFQNKSIHESETVIIINKIDVYGFGICIYQLISGKQFDALQRELSEKVQGKREHEKWLVDNVKNMKINKKTPNQDTKEFLLILTECLRTNPRDRLPFKELAKRIGVFNSRFAEDIISSPLPSSGSVEEYKEALAKIEKVGIDMSVQENSNQFENIIIQLMTNNPLPIGELKFLGCNLNEYRIQEVTGAMKLNKTVETFSISENKIEKESIVEIANMLRFNSKLKVLNLTYNKMNDEHIIPLAEGLKLTRSLHTLCLSGNNIGENGAKILLDCLTFNRNIKSIIANNNTIADKGKYFLLFKKLK